MARAAACCYFNFFFKQNSVSNNELVVIPVVFNTKIGLQTAIAEKVPSV